MQPRGAPTRTTQLLAERWATRFRDIQRGIALGQGLKFAGGFLAATAWITFILLAKGSFDFQGSDFVLPGVLTVVAILVAVLGFRRENRARKELREATAKLALELNTEAAPPQADEPSRFS